MRYLIISRYVIQEVLLSTAAVLLVLLLISLANAFVGYLADAAQGLLPLRLVLHVLMLNIPFLASFLLPLSFFFGIVLGLGRLYADSEMTALLACGYGPTLLLRTLMLPMAFIMLLTGFLNFYWAPHTMHQLIRVLAEAEQDLLLRLIMPGRFQATEDGQYVIYVESFDEDTKEAKGVFIAQQESTLEAANVITSATGYQWIDPDTQSRYIVLENGQRYFGTPGQADYEQMRFDRYGVRIGQSDAEYRVRERAQSTLALMQSKTPKARAELQWRLCLSFSVVVLAVLALLLAQLKPRQGKYGNALPAILVMIVYTNLLVLSKGWVEDGQSDYAMYGVVLVGLLLSLAWFTQRIRLFSWKK